MAASGRRSPAGSRPQPTCAVYQWQYDLLQGIAWDGVSCPDIADARALCTSATP
jgi:hypothetical protein